MEKKTKKSIMLSLAMATVGGSIGVGAMIPLILNKRGNSTTIIEDVDSNYIFELSKITDKISSKTENELYQILESKVQGEKVTLEDLGIQQDETIGSQYRVEYSLYRPYSGEGKVDISVSLTSSDLNSSVAKIIRITPHFSSEEDFIVHEIIDSIGKSFLVPVLESKKHESPTDAAKNITNSQIFKEYTGIDLTSIEGIEDKVIFETKINGTQIDVNISIQGSQKGVIKVSIFGFQSGLNKEEREDLLSEIERIVGISGSDLFVVESKEKDDILLASNNILGSISQFQIYTEKILNQVQNINLVSIHSVVEDDRIKITFSIEGDYIEYYLKGFEYDFRNELNKIGNKDSSKTVEELEFIKSQKVGDIVNFYDLGVKFTELNAGTQIEIKIDKEWNGLGNILVNIKLLKWGQESPTKKLYIIPSVLTNEEREDKIVNEIEEVLNGKYTRKVVESKKYNDPKNVSITNPYDFKVYTGVDLTTILSISKIADFTSREKDGNIEVTIKIHDRNVKGTIVYTITGWEELENLSLEDQLLKDITKELKGTSARVTGEKSQETSFEASNEIYSKESFLAYSGIDLTKIQNIEKANFSTKVDGNSVVVIIEVPGSKAKSVEFKITHFKDLSEEETTVGEDISRFESEYTVTKGTKMMTPSNNVLEETILALPGLNPSLPTKSENVSRKYRVLVNINTGIATVNVRVSSNVDPNVEYTKTFIISGFETQNEIDAKNDVKRDKENFQDRYDVKQDTKMIKGGSNYDESVISSLPGLSPNLPINEGNVTRKYQVNPNIETGIATVVVTITSNFDSSIFDVVTFEIHGFITRQKDSDQYIVESERELFADEYKVEKNTKMLAPGNDIPEIYIASLPGLNPALPNINEDTTRQYRVETNSELGEALVTVTIRSIADPTIFEEHTFKILGFETQDRIDAIWSVESDKAQFEKEYFVTKETSMISSGVVDESVIATLPGLNPSLPVLPSDVNREYRVATDPVNGVAIVTVRISSINLPNIYEIQTFSISGFITLEKGSSVLIVNDDKALFNDLYNVTKGSKMIISGNNVSESVISSLPGLNPLLPKKTNGVKRVYRVRINGETGIATVTVQITSIEDPTIVLEKTFIIQGFETRSEVEAKNAIDLDYSKFEDEYTVRQDTRLILEGANIDEINISSLPGLNPLLPQATIGVKRIYSVATDPEKGIAYVTVVIKSEVNDLIKTIKKFKILNFKTLLRDSEESKVNDDINLFNKLYKVAKDTKIINPGNNVSESVIATLPGLNPALPSSQDGIKREYRVEVDPILGEASITVTISSVVDSSILQTLEFKIVGFEKQSDLDAKTSVSQDWDSFVDVYSVLQGTKMMAEGKDIDEATIASLPGLNPAFPILPNDIKRVFDVQVDKKIGIATVTVTITSTINTNISTSKTFTIIDFEKQDNEKEVQDVQRDKSLFADKYKVTKGTKMMTPGNDVSEFIISSLPGLNPLLPQEDDKTIRVYKVKVEAELGIAFVTVTIKSALKPNILDTKTFAIEGFEIASEKIAKEKVLQDRDLFEDEYNVDLGTSFIEESSNKTQAEIESLPGLNPSLPPIDPELNRIYRTINNEDTGEMIVTVIISSKEHSNIKIVKTFIIKGFTIELKKEEEKRVQEDKTLFNDQYRVVQDTKMISPGNNIPENTIANLPGLNPSLPTRSLNIERIYKVTVDPVNGKATVTVTIRSTIDSSIETTHQFTISGFETRDLIEAREHVRNDFDSFNDSYLVRVNTPIIEEGNDVEESVLSTLPDLSPLFPASNSYVTRKYKVTINKITGEATVVVTITSKNVLTVSKVKTFIIAGFKTILRDSAEARVEDDKSLFSDNYIVKKDTKLITPGSNVAEEVLLSLPGLNPSLPSSDGYVTRNYEVSVDANTGTATVKVTIRSIDDTNVFEDHTFTIKGFETSERLEAKNKVQIDKASFESEYTVTEDTPMMEEGLNIPESIISSLPGFNPLLPVKDIEVTRQYNVKIDIMLGEVTVEVHIFSTLDPTIKDVTTFTIKGFVLYSEVVARDEVNSNSDLYSDEYTVLENTPLIQPGANISEGIISSLPELNPLLPDKTNSINRYYKVTVDPELGIANVTVTIESSLYTNIKVTKDFVIKGFETEERRIERERVRIYKSNFEDIYTVEENTPWLEDGSNLDETIIASLPKLNPAIPRGLEGISRKYKIITNRVQGEATVVVTITSEKDPTIIETHTFKIIGFEKQARSDARDAVREDKSVFNDEYTVLKGTEIPFAEEGEISEELINSFPGLNPKLPYLTDGVIRTYNVETIDWENGIVFVQVTIQSKHYEEIFTTHNFKISNFKSWVDYIEEDVALFGNEYFVDNNTDWIEDEINIEESKISNLPGFSPSLPIKTNNVDRKYDFSLDKETGVATVNVKVYYGSEESIFRNHTFKIRNFITLDEKLEQVINLFEDEYTINIQDSKKIMNSGDQMLQNNLEDFWTSISPKLPPRLNNFTERMFIYEEKVDGEAIGLKYTLTLKVWNDSLPDIFKTRIISVKSENYMNKQDVIEMFDEINSLANPDLIYNAEKYPYNYNGSRHNVNIPQMKRDFLNGLGMSEIWDDGKAAWEPEDHRLDLFARLIGAKDIKNVKNIKYASIFVYGWILFNDGYLSWKISFPKLKTTPGYQFSVVYN